MILLTHACMYLHVSTMTDKGQQSGRKCIKLFIEFISSRWDWGGVILPSLWFVLSSFLFKK